MSIIVDDSELLLWKHVLPAFVERCRNWEHTPSCQYKAENQVPVSVEFCKPILCSCGKGKFGNDYKVDKAILWKDISKYAVRAAISPCFPVPFAGIPCPVSESPEDMAQSFLDMLPQMMGSCFVCGSKEAKDGGKVLKCGGCMSVSYCSKECQRLDWTERDHKILCKVLRRPS